MFKKTGIVSLFLIVGAVFLGLAVRKHAFSVSRVDGSSMSPTLSDGDLVFIAKWSRDYKPGDIIIFSPSAESAERRPAGKNELYIKRLIAPPSSEVMIDDFKVLVNSHPYQESVSSPPSWGHRPFECRYSNVYKTGASEYFVLGDNRCGSADSRSFGSVPRENIHGKVIYAAKLGGWKFFR